MTDDADTARQLNSSKYRLKSSSVSATISNASEIMSLYDITKQQIRDITRSPHSAQLVDALFDRPIFTAAAIAERAKVPKPTLHKLIKSLLDAGVLDTIRLAAGRRSWPSPHY